mmetsp:Transcript_63634/g.132487  ORF Transcript_63634/g.132487 Transcript_63634/m.132487 type:complete len:238 (-) Transcript_63634:335-1048(-)
MGSTSTWTCLPHQTRLVCRGSGRACIRTAAKERMRSVLSHGHSTLVISARLCTTKASSSFRPHPSPQWWWTRQKEMGQGGYSSYPTARIPSGGLCWNRLAHREESSLSIMHLSTLLLLMPPTPESTGDSAASTSTLTRGLSPRSAHQAPAGRDQRQAPASCSTSATCWPCSRLPRRPSDSERHADGGTTSACCSEFPCQGQAQGTGSSSTHPAGRQMVVGVHANARVTRRAPPSAGR